MSPASDVDFVDPIALLHTIRWPVAEPRRMRNALHHLETMVAQSKETWKYILAEKDDDHEWIPNPRQTGVIPGVRLTDERIASWRALMDTIDKVLQGKIMIAFWRTCDDGRGVNLRKAFLEPTTLDLVLWVQGAAAAPYLQKGETTRADTWHELETQFGHHFPGFAAWLN